MKVLKKRELGLAQGLVSSITGQQRRSMTHLQLEYAQQLF